MLEEQSNDRTNSVGASVRTPCTLGGPLDELDIETRRHLARRLVLVGAVFAPFILASVLTTKAVAATKVVVGHSLPLSL
jgi:hypothetical protein